MSTRAPAGVGASLAASIGHDAKRLLSGMGTRPCHVDIGEQKKKAYKMVVVLVARLQCPVYVVSVAASVTSSASESSSESGSESGNSGR